VNDCQLYIAPLGVTLQLKSLTIITTNHHAVDKFVPSVELSKYQVTVKQINEFCTSAKRFLSQYNSMLSPTSQSTCPG